MDTANQRAGLIEGFFTVQAFLPEDYDPKALKGLYGPLPPLEKLNRGLPPAKSLGFLRAWDPIHQKLAWQIPTATHWDGGVLSTAGGLVFQGDAAGNLNVYKAEDGTKLASVAIGTGIMAAPATYRLGGVQYVVLMAGFGGNYVNYPLTKDMVAYSRDNEGRVIALKIDGGAVPQPPALPIEPFPKPPAHEGSTAQIGTGEVLYNRFCSRCHMLDRGILPDLRRLNTSKHEIFYDIVLNGLLAGAGMGRWDDVLSRKDAEAIHAFIVDESWKAYNAQTPH
jgi:quinohemoprotein ethanol dehydrogenase